MLCNAGLEILQPDGQKRPLVETFMLLVFENSQDCEVWQRNLAYSETVCELPSPRRMDSHQVVACPSGSQRVVSFEHVYPQLPVALLVVPSVPALVRRVDVVIAQHSNSDPRQSFADDELFHQIPPC